MRTTNMSTRSWLEENLAFPIPLRPNLFIKVVGIPHDLTKDEAERIARVIEATAQTAPTHCRGNRQT